MATEARPRAQASANDLLDFVAEKAKKYVREVPERRVGPAEADLSALPRLNEPFPEGSTDPHELLAKLDEIGSPATATTTGGRYFGFVNGGILPAALAANWLAGAWNQNVALRVMSPIAAELEEVVLRWVARRCACRRTAKEDWSRALRWRTLRRSSQRAKLFSPEWGGMSLKTECLERRP
jgi:hypothetical protein